MTSAGRLQMSPRWEVQIFGKVPDILVVEAETVEDAISEAATKILDELLDFEAEIEEQKPKLELIHGGKSAQVDCDSDDDARRSTTA